MSSIQAPNSGSAQRPRIFIQTAAFSDGNSLTFSPGEIIVFVGANNCGKSQVLRDLNKLTFSGQSGLVATSATFERTGNTSVLFSWLERHCKKGADEHTSDAKFSWADSHYSWPSLEQTWREPTYPLGNLHSLFLVHLSAGESLSAANPRLKIDSRSQPAHHPLHCMQSDQTEEIRISNLFLNAFGVELIVDHNAGVNVRLLCGKRPQLSPQHDRVSKPCADALASLPELVNQGDGMRSFAGNIMFSMLGEHSILLMDEPEAFLHPPQSRFLGKLLGKHNPADRQLFLATHSGDLLRGVLDSGSEKIRIIRLRRDASINHIKELTSNQVHALWSDSILRYSNILDGIFHEHVVICESDADCRFYAAIFDSIYDNSPDKHRPDVSFVHCGGKDRIKVAADALSAIDVRISAILDLDALLGSTLQELCTRIGADWSLAESDWKIVTQAIRPPKDSLERDTLKNAINQILDGISENKVTKDVAEKIRSTAKLPSASSELKKAGINAIPRGGPTKAFSALDEQLQQFGIHLVKIGELESFDKLSSLKGPEWVNSVLESGLSGTNFEQAREFVQNVLLHGWRRAG